METQKTGKLPEGVGKKIVEALKQQNIAIDATQEDDFGFNNNFQQETAFTSEAQMPEYSTLSDEVGQHNQGFADFQQNNNRSYETLETNDGFDEFDYYEETTPSIVQNIPSPMPVERTYENYELPPAPVPQPQVVYPTPALRPAAVKIESLPKADLMKTEFETPGNVEILRRLISQLPAGVTKQTGAQIIRQTMEAMGLSINSVLSEAQMVQENLGSSVKDSFNTIEEYKNNIKILERKIQSYKKQADQLGELINLFILSENRR